MRSIHGICPSSSIFGHGARQCALAVAALTLASSLAQAAPGDEKAQIRFRDIKAAPYAGENASDDADAKAPPAAKRQAPTPPSAKENAVVEWRSMSRDKSIADTAAPPIASASKNATAAAPSYFGDDDPPPSPKLDQKSKSPRKPEPVYGEDWDAAKVNAATQRAVAVARPKPTVERVTQTTYQAPVPANDDQERIEAGEAQRAAYPLQRQLPVRAVALQPVADAFGPPQNPTLTEPTPGSPFEVIDESGQLTVTIRRSKLLRTPVNIYRTAVVDPGVCDVNQFTPREVSIIGRGQGATHVTFWFEGDKIKPITYLVRVVPDPEVQQRREKQYRIFEEILAELFPDSKVHLQPIADKLIVKGQAKDGEEAAQIMAIIRGEAVRNGNRGDRTYGSLIEGRASDPIQGEERDRKLPATQVVNMLRIPGIQQVALRVKIAELNRTAARSFGVDLDMKFDVGNGSLLLQSMLNAAAGGSASVLGHFNGDKINFGIHFLEQHGVVRLLSEPTLVTMSGRPASFVAGGEFAVPTTVGISGASAVTTEFRSFGAIISFLPTVLDKDRIRLEVAPEFSKINNSLSVNNTPGLDTRAVTTTVEMREGQTLAIAGLLDDAMKYDSATDIPILCNIFGRRTGSRNETELMILVTPELVQPMDPEEVPPLPGFDVTEPSHNEFYFQGQIEGRPTRETRSTVWPTLRKRYQGTNGMMSGPFGHGQ